jgi:sec-independent protein translocase protein TatB
VNAPGFWEIVFLAVLALLIFGPERLPGVARNLGKAIGQFKREATSTLDELKRSADYQEFKGVTEEFRTASADLRSTTRDLERTASLTGPVASDARPKGGSRPPTPGPQGEQGASVVAEGPPPFDPDAT